MGKYSEKNAYAVLEKVEARIATLELKQAEDKKRWGFATHSSHSFRMEDVYAELSIFDWWVDRLSISRLKEMRTFLKLAIELGFTGYVCFKVGVTGCANGMWAHTNESENGHSPDGCDFLYRSFTPAYTYYDICYADGTELSKNNGLEYNQIKTTAQLKKLLKKGAVHA